MNGKNKKVDEIKVYDLGAELDKSKEYINKFNKAKNFNSSRQDAYAENMAFAQGNQHLLKKYKNDTPWVVNMNTPYATVAIENRVSSLLANDYIGELVPLSEEDVDSIDALSKVYKREWKRMNLDKVIRECISGAAFVREFYCHIVLPDASKTVGGEGSKNLGKIEAYAIEPSCVYIDPSARNLRDARYMFIAGRISKEEAIEKWDVIKALKDSSSSMIPSDRGEVYYDNDYSTEQEDVFTVLTCYKKEKDKIRKVKMINNIIVENKVMNLSNFPILQFRWKKAAQSCYGLSLMDEVLSLQKAITAIESAITNTAMSYAAPSVMVRKGCGVDPKMVAKTIGAPGVVYAVTGDLDNAIKTVVAPKIQQEVLNIKIDFQNQIDKITGNSGQFLGDIGTAGNTSSGANMAVDRAKIIEIAVLNNIREFVEDITHTVVEYITYIHGGDELTYNDGQQPDGKYSFTKIKLPETDILKNANYQYYIELDKKTPYSRDRQKQLLLDLYQLEAQYNTPIKTVTVRDIIKNTDIDNKDEILQRFNMLSYQDAETKADTITQLLSTGQQNGVSPELLNQAIAEIINSDEKTPAVDQVMQQLEQSFQAQVQQNNQNLNNVTNQLMAMPQQQNEVQQLANNLENGGQNNQQPMQ